MRPQLRPDTSSIDVVKRKRRNRTLCFICVGFFAILAVSVPVIVLMALKTHVLDDAIDETVGRFSITATLSNVAFTEEMSNSNSTTFWSIAEPFCDEIDAKMQASTLSSRYMTCVVDNLTNGSVVVIFSLYLRSERGVLPTKDSLLSIITQKTDDNAVVAVGIFRFLRSKLLALSVTAVTENEVPTRTPTIPSLTIPTSISRIPPSTTPSSEPQTTTPRTTTSTNAPTTTQKTRMITSLTTSVTTAQTTSPKNTLTTFTPTITPNISTTESHSTPTTEYISISTIKPTGTATTKSTVTPTTEYTSKSTTESTSSPTTEPTSTSTTQYTSTSTRTSTSTSTTSTSTTQSTSSSTTQSTSTTPTTTSTQTSGVYFSKSNISAYLDESILIECNVKGVGGLSKIVLTRGENKTSVSTFDGKAAGDSVSGIKTVTNTSFITGVDGVLKVYIASAQCGDKGNYFCHAVGTDISQETVSTITLTRSPEKPTLTLSSDMIENKYQWASFPTRCYGEVGHAGILVLELLQDDNVLTLHNKVSINTVTRNDNDCSTKGNVTYYNDVQYTMGWDRALMRCSVKDVETEEINASLSVTKVVRVVPVSICNGVSNGGTKEHPYECSAYVTCLGTSIVPYQACTPTECYQNSLCVSCELANKCVPEYNGTTTTTQPPLAQTPAAKCGTADNKTPGTPTLKLPLTLAAGERTKYDDDYMSCKAEVGYPPGYVELKYFNSSTNKFEQFADQNLGIADSSMSIEVDCNTNKSDSYHYIPFTQYWNNTRFRCDVFDSTSTLHSSSTEQTLKLLTNTCIQDGTGYSYHPFDCHLYKRCFSGGILAVNTCGTSCPFEPNATTVACAYNCLNTVLGRVACL